jgi:3-phenylpropionate/trans-cinnamate dioxygenase alpha subunit
MNMFPNFTSLPPNTIRVWHPKGPNAMEVYAWVLVDVAAPDEVKAAIRRRLVRTFNAGGMWETDDGENWSQIAKNVSTSPRVRDLMFNYQMGLGHEFDTDDDYPGTVGRRFHGDVPARGFYRRWLELMCAPDPLGDSRRTGLAARPDRCDRRA